MSVDALATLLEAFFNIFLRTRTHTQTDTKALLRMLTQGNIRTILLLLSGFLQDVGVICSKKYSPLDSIFCVGPVPFFNLHKRIVWTGRVGLSQLHWQHVCKVLTLAHIHIHTHIYTHTYIHTHTYAITHINTHTYIHTHTYICNNTYTHTHTYIHMNTYTHIHVYVTVIPR